MGRAFGKWLGAVLAAALVLATSNAVAEGLLSELRLGVLDHNLEPGGKEGGTDLNGEMLLRAPGWQTGSAALDVLLNPRPHLGASLNLAGETSQVYAGVTWQVPIGESFFLEAGFGGAWHDGPLDVPGVASYGCRLNFRETGSAGWRLSERWSLIASVDHMSNADLCGRNRGLTSGGLRLGYSLD